MDIYFFPKAVLPWSLRASDSLIWESVEVIDGVGWGGVGWGGEGRGCRILENSQGSSSSARGGEKLVLKYQGRESLAVPTRTLVHGTVSLRSGVPGDESERFFPAGPGSSRRSVCRSVCRRRTNTRPVHASILCVGSHPPFIVSEVGVNE